MSPKSQDQMVEMIEDIIKPEEVRETHISIAFLTDQWVYKMKKPLDLGFLNYCSLEERRKYCLLEKELNQRFSRGIYQEVLKVVSGEGRPQLVDLDHPGKAREYLLKMERIGCEEFLQCQVENNEISSEDMRSLGQRIGKFLYRQKDTKIEKKWGRPEQIKANCEENFEQTADFPAEWLDPDEKDFIEKASRQFFENNEDLFQKRLEEGFVIEGHGDLRLEHVYLRGDEVGLIDCIEFNERFRINDVVSEIAFLAMELDFVHKIDLADALLEGFFEIFDDGDSKILLNFYRCYRAYVRFKVGGFLLGEKGRKWSRYEEKRQEVYRLGELAYGYALNLGKPCQLVFCGLMGTGKSVHARRLAERLPLDYANTDVVRKEVHHLDPTEEVSEDFGQGLYSEEKSLQVYSLLGKRAASKAKLQRMTLTDGSFSKESYREEFFSQGKDERVVIHFTAPPEVVKKRLAQREEISSISDGRREIMEEQRVSCDPYEAHLTIDSRGEIDENLREVLDYLENLALDEI